MEYGHNEPPQPKPVLAVYQAIWALDRYTGEGREWTLEEKLERIAAAGFQGVFGRLPEPGMEERWRRLQAKHGLAFGVESFPMDVSDFRPFLERAKAFDVAYVNAQVGTGFLVGERAVDTLAGLMEEAERSGFPFYVETHRGRVTQDLLRTADYVRQLPGLRLTIDFSHYVLAGELTAPSEEAEPYFDELLQRTSSIHGRVSNGEQIQIDIGAGDHPKAEPFKRWWEKGMRYWYAQAKPGEVLPFVCEIGRHYAITRSGLPSEDSAEELSDRWEQSLVMKRVAEEAWSRAVGGQQG